MLILRALLLLAAVARSGDGVPIHYTVEGRGEPALVFVHCWNCDRHFWDAQLRAFRKTHRVVAIDLAGTGTRARTARTGRSKPSATT
jgi:pimeloyl-ACP methyl ester carboxylesterase